MGLGMFDEWMLKLIDQQLAENRVGKVDSGGLRGTDVWMQGEEGSTSTTRMC
jgi:hypothetical protein